MWRSRDCQRAQVGNQAFVRGRFKEIGDSIIKFFLSSVASCYEYSKRTKKTSFLAS